MRKNILSIIFLILALASGFFASIMIGLARMDTGIIIWTPQLIGFCLLPLVCAGLAVYIFFRK